MNNRHTRVAWVALAALTLLAGPSPSRAWDFQFLGDDSFQDEVVGTGTDAYDPTTWVPLPGWGTASRDQNAWEKSPSDRAGGGTWATEQMVSGGGAIAPPGDPKYLDRYDDNTDTGYLRLWGAKFATNAVSQWNHYNWRSVSNPGGTYPTENDETHKFTLVFRMKNLGSRRYTPDFVNREKCLVEVGSTEVYKKRDFVYAVFQQDVAEGGPYKWIFNDDQDGRNHLGGEYQRQADDDFEIYRLRGECFVYEDGSSLTGYRESMMLDLYQNEFPEPVQDLWGGGKDKPADYTDQHQQYNDALPFYSNIMFRFPETAVDEMQQYLIDYVLVEVGQAWPVGEGDDIPIPNPAGYKRTFTIDPAQTRITVTVSTELGSDSDVTPATGQVDAYLNPTNSPASIRLDLGDLNLSEDIDILIDSGNGTFDATMTAMTLDHNMWWVMAAASPFTTGPCEASYFEWNGADSQDHCIARAPGEAWNNEDDVEYTRTGWLTYTATGDICTAMGALDPPLPCTNAGDPADLTDADHRWWDMEGNGGTGCYVNFPVAEGVMVGGQTPEEPASLYYQFTQSWPLVTDGESYYGRMTIEARIVATSGENPPPVPQPPFPPDPPDHDGDGDVDAADYEHFEACATGPDIGPEAPGCEDVDLDWDDDVDHEDFGVFQACVSGDGNDLDPDCVHVVVRCE